MRTLFTIKFQVRNRICVAAIMRTYRDDKGRTACQKPLFKFPKAMKRED